MNLRTKHNLQSSTYIVHPQVHKKNLTKKKCSSNSAVKIKIKCPFNFPTDSSGATSLSATQSYVPGSFSAKQKGRPSIITATIAASFDNSILQVSFLHVSSYEFGCAMLRGLCMCARWKQHQSCCNPVFIHKKKKIWWKKWEFFFPLFRTAACEILWNCNPRVSLRGFDEFCWMISYNRLQLWKKWGNFYGNIDCGTWAKKEWISDF